MCHHTESRFIQAPIKPRCPKQIEAYSLTHHSVAPARQGIERKGAILFGDRIAQINQALIWGLEPGHWGHIAAQDVLWKEGRDFHVHIPTAQQPQARPGQLVEVSAWVSQARGSMQANGTQIFIPSFRS